MNFVSYLSVLVSGVTRTINYQNYSSVRGVSLTDLKEVGVVGRGGALVMLQ